MGSAWKAKLMKKKLADIQLGSMLPTCRQAVKRLHTLRLEVALAEGTADSTPLALYTVVKHLKPSLAGFHTTYEAQMRVGQSALFTYMRVDVATADRRCTSAVTPRKTRYRAQKASPTQGGSSVSAGAVASPGTGVNFPPVTSGGPSAAPYRLPTTRTLVMRRIPSHHRGAMHIYCVWDVLTFLGFGIKGALPLFPPVHGGPMGRLRGNAPPRRRAGEGIQSIAVAVVPGHDHRCAGGGGAEHRPHLQARRADVHHLPRRRWRPRPPHRPSCRRQRGLLHRGRADGDVLPCIRHQPR